MDNRDDRAANEALAKKRFLTIQAVRLAGALLVMLAITIIAKVLPLPEIAGYVLLIVGMIEVFVMPVIMARMWSSRSVKKREFKDANRDSGKKK